MRVFGSMVLLLSGMIGGLNTAHASTISPSPTVHIEHPYSVPSPSAAAKTELDSLPTTSRPWKATWDLDTGAVRMLYNGETDARPGDLESVSRQFLGAHSALFGLGSLSDLRRNNSDKFKIGEIVRFQQYYQGVSVFPGDVSVSRNNAGRIFLVSSGYRPNLSLDTHPSITAAQAKLRAREESKAGTPREPQLIVWAYARPFRLAWQVEVPVSLTRTDRVIVDAKTGGLIARDNIASAADPLANVYTGNPVSTPQLKQVPLTNLDASGSLTGQFVTVQKYNGQYNQQGTPQGSLDLRNTGGGFLIDPKDTRFEQTMMYYHVNRMHDFFKNTFNFTKRDGASMPAIVGVTNQDGSALNNAYYSPDCQCITFGLSSSGQDYSFDGDVIAHEYTHSVVDTLNDIGKSSLRWSEGRAMNEALADYFSATVQGEGCMGEYVTGKTDGSCGRDLTNRKHYPEEVSQSHTFKDGGTYQDFPEEHYTGEIWGAAQWDMRRSLGSATADMIIFTSLPLYPKTASFGDARVALRTADQQLNTGKAATIAMIMDNRGIAEQTPVAYAQPDQFSTDNSHVILTGYVFQDGIEPVGFQPVFIGKRTYSMTGVAIGFDTAKTVALLFIDGQGKIAFGSGSDVSDITLTANDGSKTPAKRFQVDFTADEASAGNYSLAIATTTDGKTFSGATSIPAMIVKDAGPTPDPPNEVISTPHPTPTPTTPNPIPTPPATPAQPASILLQPLGPTVTVGGQLRFTASVTDTTAKVVPEAVVNWSLENNAQQIATIAPNGILTANQAGTVTAVASIGNIRAQTNVTITSPVATQNGASWQQMPGSEKALVLSLSASASNQGMALYEAGLDSVRISLNAGQFQEIIKGLDSRTTPTSISANPQFPQVVYLATLDFGLFRSQDAGQTWVQVADDLAQYLAFEDVFGGGGTGFNASSPLTPLNSRGARPLQAGFIPYPAFISVITDAADEIAVGTLNHGAFAHLGDKGWFDINTGMGTAVMNSFQFNDDGSVGYAGTPLGAYRLRGGDPSWHSINNGLLDIGFEGGNYSLPPAVQQLAINPLNHKELLAATQTAGVFYSNNEGDSWIPVNNGINDRIIATVVFDPLVQGRMFAGTINSGVFVSTDSGKTWSPANAGLPIGTITSFAFDPQTHTTLYAGTWGAGVWKLDLKGNIVSQTPTGTGTPTLLPGDINGDGKINIQDATMSLQISVGIVTPTPDQAKAADYNGDGKINIQDATAILQKAVGL